MPSNGITSLTHVEDFVKVLRATKMGSCLQCYLDMCLGTYLPRMDMYSGDTPASTQMNESLKTSNKMNGGMRVEGRITCPSESTPTEH